MSSKFEFLSLPAELRQMIYGYLIQDVHMVFHHSNVPHVRVPSDEGYETAYKKIDRNDLLEYVDQKDIHKVALLQASKFCYDEAIHLVASETTLEIQQGGSDFDECKVLELIDPRFLEHVPILHVPVNVVNLNITMLRQLKNIHFTFTCYDAMDIRQALWDYRLYCIGDFAPEAIAFYERAWRDIAHLDFAEADEHEEHFRELVQTYGCKVEFDVFFVGISRSGFDVGLKLRWDMSNGRLTSRCLLTDEGEVLLDGDDFDDKDLVEREEITRPRSPSPSRTPSPGPPLSVLRAALQSLVPLPPRSPSQSPSPSRSRSPPASRSRSRSRSPSRSPSPPSRQRRLTI